MNTKAFSIIAGCLLVSNSFIELQAENFQEWGPYGGGLRPYYGGGLRPGVGLRSKRNAGGLRPYGSGAGLRPGNGAGLRSKRSATEPILDITVSAVEEILITRNTTSNRCILIDNQGVVLLLDGTTTCGIIINQGTNESTLIRSDLWNATEQSLTEYLNSIGNDISSLSQKPDSEDFTLPNVPLSFLKSVNYILKDLVACLDPDLEQRPELGLELILSVATGIEDLLNGLLDGILELIGTQQIEVAFDISGLLNVLKALNVCAKTLQMSVKELPNPNGSLDIGQIIGARDGLSALSQTIRQLADSDIDLSPLNEVLGDPEQLTKLIAQLGGEQSIGITGLFRVLGEIIALVNGNTTLDRLISILITVVGHTNREIRHDLRNILKNSLSNLLEILEQIEPQTLDGLVKIVKDLLNEEFICDKVNISDIISMILASATQPKEKLLSIVVKILQSLDAIVEPSATIRTLLLVLIVQLDSATGVETLIYLGLDIDDSGCTCSLLEIALQSIQSVRNELFTDLYAALCELPIIGTIIESLDVAISVENLSLKDLLDTSELVQDLIRGIIQLVSDIELEIEQEILDQCKELMINCFGLSTLVEVEVTVTVTITSSD